MFMPCVKNISERFKGENYFQEGLKTVYNAVCKKTIIAIITIKPISINDFLSQNVGASPVALLKETKNCQEKH